MIYLLYTIHVLVSLFLILVVLLQQGKGADLSVFGGGSTQTAFGARGAATVLHKLTVVCFVAFILTTLGIAIMKNTAGGSSVIDDAAVTEQEATDESDEAGAAGTDDPGTDEATPNGEANGAAPAEADAVTPNGADAAGGSDVPNGEAEDGSEGG